MNKNIYKFLLAGIALAATVASCDLNKVPEFDDADSFAGFDATSYTFDENVGTIKIPVTIASIDPKQTVVSYTVIDGEGDQGAKVGTDVIVKDESSVLSFDGTVRTQYIELEIKERMENGVSAYTGDLTFTIRLESAGSINVGADNLCTITITDLDHPLADILGTYTAQGSDRGNPYSWTLTLSKDDEDPNVVWADALVPFAVSYPGAMKVYGRVSADHKEITFSTGQETGLMAADDDPFVLCEYKGGMELTTEVTEIVFESDDLKVFKTDKGICFVPLKAMAAYPGTLLDPGTITWTKQ